MQQLAAHGRLLDMPGWRLARSCTCSWVRVSARRPPLSFAHNALSPLLVAPSPSRVGHSSIAAPPLPPPLHPLLSEATHTHTHHHCTTHFPPHTQMRPDTCTQKLNDDLDDYWSKKPSKEEEEAGEGGEGEGEEAPAAEEGAGEEAAAE